MTDFRFELISDHMITLYRRHSTDCPVHKIKKMTPKAKKRYTDCDCAIWMNGTGEHTGRKSADTRDWKVAIAKMQALDAKSKDAAVYGLTLADAIQKFLDSTEHRIKGTTLDKYKRILKGRLLTFAGEKNLTHRIENFQTKRLPPSLWMIFVVLVDHRYDLAILHRLKASGHWLKASPIYQVPIAPSDIHIELLNFAIERSPH